jgi:hypothetical protein
MELGCKIFRIQYHGTKSLIDNSIHLSFLLVFCKVLSTCLKDTSLAWI